MRLESARAVKAELTAHAASLRADAPTPTGLRGTVAVGICVLGSATFGVAVRYTGESGLSRAVAARGRALAGDECDVRDVGVVRSFQWEPGELQGRVRPLRPGLSVAHVAVTAGTIGAFVTSADDAVLVLSNNHVLADSDRGSPGDVVVQPGPADGGDGSADRVGVLDVAAALRQDGANLVDAAAARLDADVAVEAAHPAGLLVGWAEVDDDRAVEKVGRTTGVTRGRISAIELDGLRVQYPLGSFSFDDQIEVTGDGPGPFSAGGDSGSVVYRPDALEAVGLLFAGSERGGPGGVGLTYCNPFGAVLDQLGVRLVSP
ncbi:MAG: hypothetical protein ACRDWI_02805 [Jiangellaceae bacterium]